MFNAKAIIECHEDGKPWAYAMNGEGVMHGPLSDKERKLDLILENI